MANCQMSCASPRVEKVDLYLTGGFMVQGDRIVGKGDIEVRPQSECTVVSQKGGGIGSSCRIAGPKHGGFTVSGRVLDMVVIDGKLHAPKVEILLHPTGWPDLLVNFFLSIDGKEPFPVPVNHYQGSYQSLMEESGLLGTPITLVAVYADTFVTDQIMSQISKDFSAEINLGAPGFSRALSGSGKLAFTASPHSLKPK